MGTLFSGLIQIGYAQLLDNFSLRSMKHYIAIHHFLKFDFCHKRNFDVLDVFKYDALNPKHFIIFTRPCHIPKSSNLPNSPYPTSAQIPHD